MNATPRDLGDDHYKRMPRVTVRVARQRTLTAHQQLWRLHMSEKFSSGKKTSKQKNKQTDCHCSDFQEINSIPQTSQQNL